MSKAVAVAYVTGGSLLVYSGIKGSTVSDTVRAALSGNLAVTNTENISSGSAGGVTGSAPGTVTGVANPASNTAAANQALAKQLAIKMGHADWTTGQNWDSWVKLWNQESGWSITAANPTSSARGIAQNINGYGPGYKEGDAVSQITWGINYIAGRYGSPAMAWTHEVQNNWY